MNWKTIGILGIVGVLAIGSISGGCLTSGGGHGVEALEQMSPAEFENWKLFITLGVKVGARRLLDEGVVSLTDLETAAEVFDGVATSEILPGATSILEGPLEEAGFTNDEAKLVLLIVERELLSRGGLNGVLDPETGLLHLAPRTQEVLKLTATSLRSVTTITPDEFRQAEQMHADFSQR
jgi:hypothetical protein